MHDYYSILSVSPSATPAEIKAAYHHCLLSSHPDKRGVDSPDEVIDIGLLKDAFRTLITPELRIEYEKLRSNGKQLGPRPAQVVSLEEFNEESESRWTYSCRCGGIYLVTEEMLEAGLHAVACASCSEVVWVGYEEMEGDGQ